MTEFARSLAVVIGINEYHHGIAQLTTAVADAMAISKILQNTYEYELVHPDFETGVIVNHYATKDKLKTLLTDILPNKIKPTESDRLLVYFAGHGIARSSDTGTEGYLVSQDADTKNRDSLLKSVTKNNKTPLKDMVVILPGITGSVLQKNGKDIWGDFPRSNFKYRVE